MSSSAESATGTVISASVQSESSSSGLMIVEFSSDNQLQLFNTPIYVPPHSPASYPMIDTIIP